MNNSRTLLLSTLIAKKACSEQVDLFRATFGKSVEITPELCIKHAQHFDWRWASQNLLSNPARKIYDETHDSARKIYDETCDSALKIYDETCAPAWKIYNKTCDSALKIYNETCAPAGKIYDETRDSALKIYSKTRAKTFANLYIQEQ